MGLFWHPPFVGFFQVTDSVALVVLQSLRHAPRRHCLEAQKNRRAPQGPNHNLRQSSEVPGESVSKLTFGSKHLVISRVNFGGLRLGGLRHFAIDVGKTVLGRSLALFGPVGQRLRTASTHWNVPGKYGPHGELFFFLIQKEPMVASNQRCC